ncbi:hypothetical protein PISMIDRAFT_629149 [Pisolithus microcarpus 441]|uniref:Sister chromatid cohesion protein DCC1 n=1 Tax=Pisolithus microcarpus 441 TaxID=765257 RepID=A0A0C9ZPS0_9AGAM|nr:sister chromatid cohesion protein Dcc1 [Pisolithus microcarpus]KIK28049.1 hypothetical protein PISMIDRAFT_629149 [Pisolithus microcarpus 441]
MSDMIDVRFSPSTTQDAGSFRLIELPSELCQLIESTTNAPCHAKPSLCIKGNIAEDAVLCTTDKTYTLRSVVLSNTLLVTTPSRTDPGGTVNVRDRLHEVLELVPSVPKLHKLPVLLKGAQYDEGDEDQRAAFVKYCYNQASSEIQASEAEFQQGLKEKRILVLDGYLRPIVPAHLSTILELILSYTVTLSLSCQAAEVEELVSTLADEHEVPREVSAQIISWFGTVKEGLWEIDIRAVVAEIGLEILRHHKHEPIVESDFLSKWKNKIGDTFEAFVALELLTGNYLRSDDTSGGATLTYFPASGLPTDPAARFTELFLTKQRWKSNDIEPFLLDIAINSKERDKLLLKYARAITAPESTWYTSRVGYNN